MQAIDMPYQGIVRVVGRLWDQDGLPIMGELETLTVRVRRLEHLEIAKAFGVLVAGHHVGGGDGTMLLRVEVMLDRRRHGRESEGECKKRAKTSKDEEVG